MIDLCSKLEIQPDTAMQAVIYQLIPIEKVQVSDELTANPGDHILVDAVVIDGKSTLDDSMLIGETRRRPKLVDDKVTSGTINCGKASFASKPQPQSTIALWPHYQSVLKKCLCRNPKLQD